MTAALSVMSVGIAIWTLRNERELGAPIWATTHGGYTLLLANNPPLYDHLSESVWPTYWNPERFFQGWEARGAGDLTDPQFWKNPPQPVPITLDEVQDNERATAAAKNIIRASPARFVQSSIVRIGWLWSPVPQVGSFPQRLLVGAWYSFIYAAVAISLWRFRGRLFQSAWLGGWTFILALTITHAVYWSNLRMRAPAMPAMVIMAVGAFLPKTRSGSLHEQHEGTIGSGLGHPSAR